MKARVEQGATVILTTHILEVAERMAEKIGVIAAGQLVAEGTLAELSRRAGGKGGDNLEEVFLALVAESAQVQAEQAQAGRVQAEAAA